MNVSHETFIISKCVILLQITENHEKNNENYKRQHKSTKKDL